MPSPALRSVSLYRVPDIGAHLVALGYQASKPGYVLLKDAVAGRGRIRRAFLPGERTVFDMMTHRIRAKYDTCDRLRDALLDEANEKGIELLPVVEEHEHLIAGFSRRLDEIGKRHLIKAAVVRDTLAQKADLHRPLVRAMAHKYRTTEENCRRLTAAARELYGVELVVTNALAYRHPTGRPYVAVPPADEGLF